MKDDKNISRIFNILFDYIKQNRLKLLALTYFILLFMGVGYSLRSASKEVFSLEKKVIIIDPGHGGSDPGKVVSQGEKEKAINLKIASFLKEYLEQSGALVYMTRQDDTALSDIKREDLKKRRSMTEARGADAFISIHQNFYPSEKVKGAQVFYPKASEEGKKLADFIQGRIKEIADSSNKRITKENDSYFVLKNVKKPSVIVECGFLSNPKENRLLNSEEYQKKMAWAIFAGIIDYFQQANNAEANRPQTAKA